jgi:hypothetical protein
MPVQVDYEMVKYEDGVLNISMNPSVNIGGWSIRFVMGRHFGGDLDMSGRIVKSTASGFDGVSGITILDSGAGRFKVTGIDTSGLEVGNHAYSATRVDSGARTVLVAGYVKLMTEIG